MARVINFIGLNSFFFFFTFIFLPKHMIAKIEKNIWNLNKKK